MDSISDQDVPSWFRHTQYKDLCCPLQEICRTTSFFVSMRCWLQIQMRIFLFLNNKISQFQQLKCCLCGFFLCVFQLHHTALCTRIKTGLSKLLSARLSALRGVFLLTRAQRVRAAQAVISHWTWSLCSDHNGLYLNLTVIRDLKLCQM